MELNTVQLVAVYALPVIFAITLHEAAHAYVAKHFGDLTAYQEGRVSLNPIRHIDPLGTIVVPLLTMVFGGMMFGWAKPVPVDFARLRRPKRDMLWVAFAGPGANLAMAIGWGILLHLTQWLPASDFAKPMALMAVAGMNVNAAFFVLNMLPIPPLDGGRILISLLPPRQAYEFSKIEPYGMYILIALLLTHVLDMIMRPLMNWVLYLVSLIAGV